MRHVQEPIYKVPSVDVISLEVVATSSVAVDVGGLGEMPMKLRQQPHTSLINFLARPITGPLTV